MERWVGKVAVITGAGSGIGAATALLLAKHGLTVVGLDLNHNLVKELAVKNSLNNIHPVQCNVMDSNSISTAFDYIEKTFNGVDILINNAGARRKGQIFNLNIPDDNFTLTIDTIFKGSLLCTRRAFKTMRLKEVGYIINMNSILGHASADTRQVINGSNVYGATKHALTTLSDILRLELAVSGNTKIKVTSISPGCVETGFAAASGADPTIYKTQPALKPSDIADTIAYLLEMKWEVSISEITIRPTGEKI